MMRRAWAAILLAIAASVRAADSDDEAALRLADRPPEPQERRGDWRALAEAAREESLASGSTARFDRLSIDALYDAKLTSALRVVVADRLDARWLDRRDSQRNVNTLKEAYASWLPAAERIVDAGRINTRYGVAFAYNPTDYFKTNAVRSVVSIDPASARENRLGSVMARGQALWEGGSVTAMYSPKLADHATDDAFSLDLGATNARDRWELVASQQMSATIAPQAIVHGAAGAPIQYGLNVSAVPNSATVAYLEASVGRSSSLLAQALGSDDKAFRSRFSAGATYTTPTKVSLTFECEYNGAGLDRARWDALRNGSLRDYARYRAFVTALQDMPTKRRLYARVAWQDALVDHLDLTWNGFFNPIDASRQHGLEARYHWKVADAAVQWQLRSGAFASEFGALAAQHSWQVLVQRFF